MYHTLRSAVEHATRYARQLNTDFIVVRDDATGKYGWFGASGIVNLTGFTLILRVNSSGERMVNHV